MTENAPTSHKAALKGKTKNTNKGMKYNHILAHTIPKIRLAIVIKPNAIEVCLNQ